MTATDVLERLEVHGVRVKSEGGRVVAWPSNALTDELRELIREHRTELLSALAPTEQRGSMTEGTHSKESASTTTPGARSQSVAPPASSRGTDCVRCANLEMKVEHHPETRRIFWWRCVKGYELLEGRNFGQRVLLAPPECDISGDFRQWEPGTR